MKRIAAIVGLLSLMLVYPPSVQAAEKCLPRTVADALGWSGCVSP